MKMLAERINFKDIFLIIVGTLIVALSINLVFDPMGLDTGGVTGLSIVIRYATMKFFPDVFPNGIPVWFSNVLLNVPLFIIAIKTKGFKYMMKTGFATIMLTVWIYVIPVVQILTDSMLSALFGGVLSGTGMGIVFSAMATTGGTDLFSALLHDKFKYLSLPKILAITDGTIVAIGILIFNLESMIYSIIVVYLVSKISDAILEGLKFAKLVYIISDDADKIAAEILVVIDRGVTGIRVKGMYSGNDKKMLFCAVGKKQVVELTDIVSRIDKNAFMIVTDAREVMGEGFREVKIDN